MSKRQRRDASSRSMRIRRDLLDQLARRVEEADVGRWRPAMLTQIQPMSEDLINRFRGIWEDGIKETHPTFPQPGWMDESVERADTPPAVRFANEQIRWGGSSVRSLDGGVSFRSPDGWTDLPNNNAVSFYKWHPGDSISKGDLGRISSSFRETIVHTGPTNLYNALDEQVRKFMQDNTIGVTVMGRRFLNPPLRSASSMILKVPTIPSLFDQQRHKWSAAVIMIGGGVLGQATGGGAFDDHTVLEMARYDAISREMYKARVGVWAIFDNVLHVSPVPKSMTEESFTGFLDNPGGPAVTFDDGTEIYALDGIVMSKAAHCLIRFPDLIKMEHLFDPDICGGNEEVRRLLMRAKGIEELINEYGGGDDGSWGEFVQEDEYGKLYNFLIGGVSVRIVLVENFTPEPDGSRRKYALTVPPTVNTAREAVAWTYGFTEPEQFSITQSA